MISYITIKHPNPFIQPGPTVDGHIRRERVVHQTKCSARRRYYLFPNCYKAKERGSCSITNKKESGIHHRLNIAKKSRRVWKKTKNRLSVKWSMKGSMHNASIISPVLQRYPDVIKKKEKVKKVVYQNRLE